MGTTTSEDESVEVVPYSENWPVLFVTEAALLQAALNPWLVAEIKHVSRTAVVGLHAKPIIDIMAPVQELEASRPAIEAAKSLGYCYQVSVAYTHRVAVSNERIVGIDAHGVRLRVRTDDNGGKRTVVVDGPTLIGRFLQHVLPPGFKRIRHYWLLRPALKTQRLPLARAALEMPAANAKALPPSSSARPASTSPPARIASAGAG